MADLFASGKFTATTDAGAPLAGGQLFSYAAGTLTPLATFTTQAGNVSNSNPVILDSAGRANVWLGPLAYRLILKTAADVTLWDTDNVLGSVASADLSASTGSSLVGHIASGAGAVATTAQAKFLGLPASVSDYSSLAAALATGRDIEIPYGTTVSAAGLTITTQGQRIFGRGTITWNDAAQHLFNVQADDVEISVARINGTATAGTNSTFAIFTATATPANRLKVLGVLFSGANAGVGCNNGVKFDDSCNYGLVQGCHFERLWGNASGRGYGVLAGAAKELNIIGNRWYGSSGRGRHAYYASAGAARCKIAFNHAENSDYESITLNSTGIQPANTDNEIIGNTVVGCCAAIPGVSTGGISIFGHASANLIALNTIRASKGCGIKIDGTGFPDLADTQIKNNTIISADYIGIDILAGVGGALVGNTVKESSSAAAGTHSNIRMVSDATTASSDWLIEGNKSSGITYARSAFQLNATAPTPSSLKVFGNKFDTCNLTDVELGGVVCSIDGRLRFAQAAVTFGPIANGASLSTGYSIDGVASGDLVTVSHTSNSDGCAIYCYASGAGTVTVVVSNNSGGAKTIASGTLYIDIWKRAP